MISVTADLQSVVEELYGAPPADFTRLRTEAAKLARTSGNKELAEAKGHVPPAQEELERLTDLTVEKRQHARAPVHQRHLRPQPPEDRGVFDADDSGADHRHGPRHPVLEPQDAKTVLQWAPYGLR